MKLFNPYVLMLEDDEDDRHITETYFGANGFDIKLEFLSNSEEVMPYLQGCIERHTQLPCLILLDKNAPAGGGMAVLKSIKSHQVFSVIPVIMISGTAFPGEINESYRLGANSFIIKPLYSELTAKKILYFLNYWFTSVELPETDSVTMSLN